MTKGPGLAIVLRNGNLPVVTFLNPHKPLPCRPLAFNFPRTYIPIQPYLLTISKYTKTGSSQAILTFL